MFAQHFNGIISRAKHWSGSRSPYNTWWSYEDFVVSLHFSLENAAFHTESREIAKGCTEIHSMKKEDEQFGHSTSLDFYPPMVSNFLASLRVLFQIWRPGGIRAFLAEFSVGITNMGTPGPSLHTVYW